MYKVKIAGSEEILKVGFPKNRRSWDGSSLTRAETEKKKLEGKR